MSWVVDKRREALTTGMRNGDGNGVVDGRGLLFAAIAQPPGFLVSVAEGFCNVALFDGPKVGENQVMACGIEDLEYSVDEEKGFAFEIFWV